jgi:hypothetical protein
MIVQEQVIPQGPEIETQTWWSSLRSHYHHHYLSKEARGHASRIKTSKNFLSTFPQPQLLLLLLRKRDILVEKSIDGDKESFLSLRTKAFETHLSSKVRDYEREIDESSRSALFPKVLPQNVNCTSSRFSRHSSPPSQVLSWSNRPRLTHTQRHRHRVVVTCDGIKKSLSTLFSSPKGVHSK